MSKDYNFVLELPLGVVELLREDWQLLLEVVVELLLVDEWPHILLRPQLGQVLPNPNHRHGSDVRHSIRRDAVPLRY